MTPNGDDTIQGMGPDVDVKAIYIVIMATFRYNYLTIRSI